MSTKLSPVRIGTDSDWVAVAAGWFATVALKTNGTLWACGSNSRGNLGDDTTTNRYFLTQVGTDSDWVCIAVGWLETGP